MSYRRFNLAQLGLDPATLATFRDQNSQTVASVATVADLKLKNRGLQSGMPDRLPAENPDPTSATVATVATLRGENRQTVASVATVASLESGHVALQRKPDVPSEWLDGVAQLQLIEPHNTYGLDGWRQLIGDAENFLLEWGTAAAGLGWTTLDLFGVHPAAPTARYDAMGLVPLIMGRAVMHLTDRSATIRGSSGTSLTYLRCTRAGGVPIWTIGSSEK